MSQHQEKPGQERKAGIWRQDLKQRPWRTFSDLLSHLPNAARPTCPGLTAPGRLGLPNQLAIKKMPTDTPTSHSKFLLPQRQKLTSTEPHSDSGTAAFTFFRHFSKSVRHQLLHNKTFLQSGSKISEGVPQSTPNKSQLVLDS